MKTAMQDLIGFIDFLIKDCHHYESTRISQLVVIKERAKEYLEKEKEQIIDAYYSNIDGVYGYREAGEQYYNQTYNQNK
jgi:hypothetical protein